MKHAVPATLVALVLAAAPAVACLWDYDTIEMERYRFPKAMELIAGKFLRHSREFYEWRIDDRKTKLANGSYEASYYDDLAVAYDKTGQQQLAIETMLAKQERYPGLYETEANLGTFYIHAGEFEKGLEHIERAIAIDPNAHFGREVYQKLLVEYILSKRKAGVIPQPLHADGRSSGLEGFAEFVMERRGEGPLRFDREEIQLATKGVLGMMRFGHHDSPILLEALGDLVLAGGERADAKRIAARAYLKASYGTDDEEAKEAYRVLAENALLMQRSSSHDEAGLRSVEAQLEKEIAEADTYFDTIRADELAWIEAGADVDQEFSKKYYEAPELSTPPPPAARPSRIAARIVIGLFLALPLLAVLTVLAIVLRPKKREGDRSAVA